nr:uncharacterized protein LOC111420684 [Onthophagus taurus]
MIKNNNSNEIIGVGNFKVTKFEVCDPSYDYPLKVIYKFRKDDAGNQFLSGEGHFKVNFGEDSDFNISITMKQSQKDEYARLVSLYDEDTCEALKKFVGPFFHDMQKASGVNPGTCPVPKGDYIMKDYKLDFSKISYQAIPEGIFRVEHTIKNIKTKEY